METKEQFVEKVKHTIEERGLIKPDDKVLVAISGGADSVALLLVLLEVGYHCEAVHCNFRLRGKEADRDETFVRRLCQSYSIRIHVKELDAISYAKANGISVEMAARHLRYDYFEELLRDWRLNVTAVGHHREDNVETLLINLLRGSGLKGLGGIHHKNGNIVRPLLDMTRKDIEDYLAQNDQDFITDSSNFETDVVRNKIRLQVLPLMSEINPNIIDTLNDTTRRLRDAYILYKVAVDELKEQVCMNYSISIKRLQNSRAPRTLLYEILSDYGFNKAQVGEIYEQINGEAGKIYESKDWRLLRDRNCLILEPKNIKKECLCSVLPLDGYVRVTLSRTFHISRMFLNHNFVIPHDKNTACLDLDKIEYPISVRFAKDGDKFIPLGMEGMKLVSDYLTDNKKNIFEKEQQLVVCCGKQIAWLVGERTDNRFKIDETTKRVLMIRSLNN